MIGELTGTARAPLCARSATDQRDRLHRRLQRLLKEKWWILVAPSLQTCPAGRAPPMKSIAEAAETAHKDVIAVVGADGANAAAVGGQAADDDRIILVAPGYSVFNAADPANDIVLPGNYSAGPVAALLSSLAPHVSPTNKVVPGIATLAQRFSYGESMDLVSKRMFSRRERRPRGAGITPTKAVHEIPPAAYLLAKDAIARWRTRSSDASTSPRRRLCRPREDLTRCSSTSRLTHPPSK